MEIPVDRLRRCDATDDEITTLRSEYADPGAAESLAARLERIADQDILDWLRDLRKAGHFGAVETNCEPSNDAPSTTENAQSEQPVEVPAKRRGKAKAE
jgi:hypothetical protein